ncbi:hypothetical protein [Hyphomicrobium facile]|uniref:Uncharacterized protein n=1 Tax=Hyphomicrobium facile TaxID=51670 RepID=A0A1I7NDF0_9HYPH|nr:hypothetical protein [Hyphomicrobium facile]SFV32669.1 hypothetical protein SAMN04488557_1683 [Hyphomicrobium facile]
MPDQAQPNLISRTIDYILGRNTLIGIASFMLLIISGYATWHGMRDFIVGVSSTPAAPAGGISISNDVLVAAVVVALTFLLWLTLRETFGAKRPFGQRLITGVLYVFLAIWSIGFGYGFWWSLISGQEATKTGLAGLQEDARDASAAVAARLDAVRGQLDNVVTWSDSQMTREETSGGSCGVASGAGKGPLYNARRSVRDAVSALRDGMTKSWLEPVQADVQSLRQAADVLGGATIEERQRNFENKASEIRGLARNIAARSNQLGQSTASEMRALADSVSQPPGKSGSSCFDPTLAERLRDAAAQADQPAELKLREAVFNEGPAGVANAVKNLWSNIGAYTASAFRYIVSGGKVLTAGHTDEGEPITGRDVIALLATIGIDMGLLALAIINPPREPPSVRPSGTLARQIRDAIDTAINRAPGADLEWVRRHFVHHNKASYLVIPNLYSCDPDNVDEAAKGMAVNQLAGVLSDLDLVRWPKGGKWWLFQENELKKLKKEESQGSDTDLTAIRKKWAEEQGLTGEDLKQYVDKRAVRNHGLFSKAERALEIAGWSEKARSDIEIFKLVDTDGLTPLLMVLNEPGGARSEGPAQAEAA